MGQRYRQDPGLYDVESNLNPDAFELERLKMSQTQLDDEGSDKPDASLFENFLNLYRSGGTSLMPQLDTPAFTQGYYQP